MTETLKRSDLAKIALAAWCNIPVEKLPAEKMWIEHPDDLSRQAWDRVINAVIEASRPTPTVEGGETQPVAWRWGCDRRDDGKPDHWTVCQTPRESRPPAPFSVAIVAEPLYSADALASRDAEIERLRGEVEDLQAYRDVITDAGIDRFDAAADRWVGLVPIVRTINAVASVFSKWADEGMMIRFRETLTNTMHLSFVEGCMVVDLAARRKLDELSAALGEAEGALETAFSYWQDWCQDEAEDDGVSWTGCTEEQHLAAKAFGQQVTSTLSTIKTAREGNDG